MNWRIASRCSFVLMFVFFLSSNSLNTRAAEPVPAEKSGSHESTAGFFSWLKGVFTVSPEEREAREADLRAKADARLKELAAAIEAATHPDTKARLQKEAASLAEKETKRRAAAEELARQRSERVAAEAATLKAREEARLRKEAEAKARQEQALKERAEAKAREAAEEKALEEERARRESERKAAVEAKRKAREEARAKAEQTRKDREAAKAKEKVERIAAREAAQKAQKEQEEREQTIRLSALQARLKTAEETRVKSEAESNARREQEKKARIEAIAKAAADRKAREEEKFKAELERQAARERTVRERMDIRSKELATAAEAAKEPEEKAKLEKKAGEFAENEARRRAAFAASEADLKARWEARSRVLDEIEKMELDRAIAPAPEKPKWKVSAGVIYREINSHTFKTDSYSKDYNIPAKARNRSYSFSPPGDMNATAERDYIDGYVRKDVWTDLDGGTWNWGYDSGRQVQNDTLALSWVGKERTDFTRETSIVRGEREKGSDNNSGVYLRAERILKEAGPVDFGLRLDASRLAFSSSGDCTTFRDSQRWAMYRQYNQDFYSLAGTGITPASSPYRGNADAPGPTINNRPDSRNFGKSTRISSGFYDAFNQVTESLDMDLYTLSLGMSLTADYERLFVAGAVGPTLTIADIDASYDETLYESSNGGSSSILAYWSDTNGNTEYSVGLFVQGELGLRLIRGFELSVFGRYDWIENVSGSVGQTRYVVNPEGGSFGGVVNYAF